MSDKTITAPRGMRQRDYMAGWRACEADTELNWGELATAAERATDLADRYVDALERISEILHAEHLRDAGKLAKVSLVIASLDQTSRKEQP